MDDSSKSREDHEEVPFFGTWRRAYGFVIVFFTIEVALFYLFMKQFS